MKMKLLGCLLVMVVGVVQAATTFDELLSEIAAAADGATVYVENDIEYTGCLIDGLEKSITLASPDGQTNVLRRASSYASGEFMKFSDDAGQVTIRNLIVDGNKAAGRQSARFIDLPAGSLTLDAGAELRNVKQAWAGAMCVKNTGRLAMNDGAVLRGFESTEYGAAVLIGADNNPTGVFTMNGGLITACVSTRPATQGNPGAWGGAVYVYGGAFNFYGGLITGNVGSNACAGIAVYGGQGAGGLHIKGTATVIDNIGNVVRDISYYNKDAHGYIYFDGPWTGRATVYAPRVPDNSGDWARWADYVREHEGYVPGEDYMPGLGNLSVQDHEDWVVNGYIKSGTVNFAQRTARLGGGRVVTATWREALATHASNDVVELFRDVELSDTAVFTNGQSLVFRSVPGTTCTISRDLSMSKGWSVMFKVSNHAAVTFEDIVIDGGADASTTWSQPTMLEAGSNGLLTLGAGAIVQNGRTKEQHPAAYVVGSGAAFVMEEGSVVRNFCTTSNQSWATAIRVGNGSACDVPPAFTMNGGVISNCVSETTASASGGYGGAVYVQNAVFNMNGGTITGNSAPLGGCAGVQLYGGGARMYFSGTATVTNNPGVHPDVYSGSDNRMFMRGSLRGRVGISCGNQALGSSLWVTCEEGATGAWSFFSAKTDPYGQYVGYMKPDDRKVYLGEADGWMNGVGFVSAYEDLAYFTPTAIDADGETLPHVFGGAACAAGGAVDVTFDEAAARVAGRTVIPLIAAREGDVLTGTWSFTVPTAGKGVWKVKPVSSAAGVTAYNLVWCPPGIVLVIR